MPLDVDGAGGHYVAGKRKVGGGVPNQDWLAILIDRLSEIPGTLQRRGEGLVGNRGRHGTNQEVSREEEKQFVAIPIEVAAGEDYRTADKVARIVIPVRRARQTLTVGKVVIGVEVLIAEVIICAAMEICAYRFW